MPSSMLQSRIQQFEALESRSKSPRASTSNVRQSITRKPVMYPPSSAAAAAKHPIHNPLDDPISPDVAAFSTMKPVLPYVPRKPRSTSVSPSPPNLGIKTSLIDLKDWNDDSPSSQTILPSRNINKPIIQKKPNVIAPALPPRNSTKTLQKPVSTSTPSSSSIQRSPELRNYSESQSLLKTSDALSPKHTYPPAGTLSAANPRQSQGHIHASSTSSFQSISLSSDSGGPGQAFTSSMSSRPGDDNDRDVDVMDDSFSFETISSGAVSNHPTSSTQDWEHDLSLLNLGDHSEQHDRGQGINLAKPPPPPPISSVAAKSRPAYKPIATHIPSRRVPPPIPPSRSKPSSHRASLASTTTVSDQSSIFSNKTSTSEHTSQSVHMPLSRPTPVPSAARIRYENLFNNTLIAQQQTRKSKLMQEPSSSSSLAPTTPRKGWRGLSVDIITNPPEPSTSSFSGNDSGDQAAEILDKELDGRYVKLIWMRSKLPKQKLRIIWDEVAVPEHSFLDKEAFVKGMWLIDEELRRAQNMRESLARGRTSGKTDTHH